MAEFVITLFPNTWVALHTSHSSVRLFASRRQLAFPPIPSHQNTLLAPGRKPRSRLLLLFFCWFGFFFPVPPACSEYIIIQTSVPLLYLFPQDRCLTQTTAGNMLSSLPAGHGWSAPSMPVGAVLGGHGGEASQIPTQGGRRGLVRSKSGRAFPGSLSHCLLSQASREGRTLMRKGFLSPGIRCLKVRCLNLISRTGFLHSQWRQTVTASV